MKKKIHSSIIHTIRKKVYEFMEEKKEYLMPDYYNTFSCKMGECRRACCEGWPITFSIEDYFRLTSCECSEELRRRIDTGVKISLSPTPDVYAQISPKYDGNCPLRREDGRCSIHFELGEECLSDICRLYPRGLRIEPQNECSCANSCEAVLELLFSREAPIEFQMGACTNPLPPMGKRSVIYSVFGHEQEARLHLIKILQNRSLPIHQRLSALGHALRDLEEIIEKQDEAEFDLWLKRAFDTSVSRNDEKDLSFALQTATGLLSYVDERSDSVREYGEAALDYFDKEAVLEKYETAKAHFESAYPKWEIYFEQMLVNHVFFEQFPFQDRPVSLWNEFVSLCAVYTLMRILGIGYLMNKTDFTQFVDLYSALFRLIDHTSFDTYAAKTLKRLGCNTPELLSHLISL